MTPAQLSRTVLHSLHGAVADAGRRVTLPERVVIESPPRRGSGDYATGAVLRAARAARLDAEPLARRLARGLAERPGIAHVEVSGPGFLNVTLDGAGRAALVRELAGGSAGGAEHTGNAGPSRGHDATPGADPGAYGAAARTVPGAPSAPDPYPAATGDAPARDAAAWAAATGEDPAALLVRTDASALFRVQYAHSRARALLHNGAALGLRPEPGAGGHGYAGPAERRLLALLADTARVAGAGDPGRLARHLDAAAGALRDLHDDRHEGCLPRGDEKPGAAHRARLALAEAAGTVLAGGLSQLGVTAPAHL
ncbi:DALR anticodon-binding domain-containing protein [Streptomyces sp. JJ36]|uniref:DALR anticodon-binding domain-containing protein n=1 Tax=Streptomyces sp. JJ36 TaxID=2736645 RepID=UPI001F3A82C0|nr:DALR anticodon-binding domain-containing protein [Streptomyces sp. JJ36]